ncbi:MAG: hypothetical protein JRF42_16445, partial [Deltaproteobacteria bacterium]|nr:hypothetical protein [Deltaproteobacteria bacterium]
MVFEGLTGQEILDITVPMTPDMAEEAMQEPDPMMDPEPDPTMDAGVGGMGGIGGMAGTGGTAGAGGIGGMGGMAGVGGMGGTTPPPPPPPPMPEIDPEIDPDVDPALERAYNVQQQTLRTIQRRFSENGHNFKLLVLEIVLSPYF